MPNFITRLKHHHKNEEESIDISVTSSFSKVPYAGLHPKDYELPQKLYAFRAELDGHIKKLFEGDIDAGNATAFDNLIEDAVTSAVEDLNAQNAEHRRLIRDLESRWAGDECEARQNLEDYKKELEATEKELAQARELFQTVNTPKRRNRSLHKDDLFVKEEKEWGSK